MSFRLTNEAAYRHCTPHDTTTQLPPKSGYGFLRFILDTIEGLPEVQEMLKAIARSRRRARPGYTPSSMLRLFCLKHLLNEQYNLQTLQRLEASPQLRDLCGFDSLPSDSTLSRFFRRLTEHQGVTRAVGNMVERLRTELPDLGTVTSIDGTDIEAYGNPDRNPRIDEDAVDGIRTAKSKSRRDADTERYYGYKLIMLADATYDVPLAYRLVPANASEYRQLRPSVEEAQATFEWLKPEYLIGDRGYDSVANHKFLVGRGIAPIIHIRKPINSKLHDGIYTTLGAPTCLGGKEMTYVRTDPETGKHLYRCPASGCEKFKSGKNVFMHCKDSHWENPADNVRVIGVVARKSKEWSDLYKLRQGVERFFSSAKRSRLLDKHLYLEMQKIETHVALSVLTYLGTMYARIKAGDEEKMRHMRIRV